MKGVPHHGLGRGFKPGKEESVGLLVWRSSASLRPEDDAALVKAVRSALP